jgi:hypothetical protein
MENQHHTQLLSSATLTPAEQSRLHSLHTAHSSRWMSVLPTCNEYKFHDDSYRCAIAHRLGVHIQRVREMRVFACVCGMNVVNDHRHFHTCKMVKSKGSIAKHNRITHALRVRLDELGCETIHEPLKNSFIHTEKEKRNRPLSMSSTQKTAKRNTMVDEDGDVVMRDVNDVIAEEQMELELLSSSQQRGDLLVIGEYGTQFVDVAIVQSDAETYVRSHTQATQNIAIQRMEMMKVEKHSDICRVKHWKMIPFILDSYGQLSSTALSFLKRMSQCSPTPTAWLDDTINDLQCALQKGNAAVAEHTYIQCIKHQSKQDRSTQAHTTAFHSRQQQQPSNRTRQQQHTCTDFTRFE